MEELDALNEMRTQMQTLKEKLAQQKIINDQMLRKVTQTRIKHLNRNVWQEGAACLFVITFGSYSFYHIGCSTWFILATILMMAVCFAVTIVSHNRVSIDNIAQGDLLTAAKQVRQLRKFYKQWKYFALPILTPWMIWLIWDIFRASNGDKFLFICTIVGLAIGIIVGGIIGWNKSNRLINEMDTIINDLENEETIKL